MSPTFLDDAIIPSTMFYAFEMATGIIVEEEEEEEEEEDFKNPGKN